MSKTLLFATRTLTCIATVATLTACSLIPAYERPSAPVPGKWPAAASVEPATKRHDMQAPIPTFPQRWEGVVLGWQDYFSDPVLKRLIDIALANNRDLRVAVLNIELARAQLGIRRADQFPNLNAAITDSRTPTGTGSFNNVYNAGLAITAYEFDFFGRVASLKEQALAQYLATTEASQTAQISLVTSVAQGWASLLADAELLVVSQQTLAARQESLKLITLKLRHGAASELELRLAQTLLEGARVTLAQQIRQRAIDENALVLLLGQALPFGVLQSPHPNPLPAGEGAKPSAPITLAVTLQQLRFAELPAGLPSDLLEQRPDIRQAEQLLIASNANIGAARAAFFPRIALTAGVGSASTDLSGLFKDGSWGWTLAPQLVLPLFDAGRSQAGLESAQAARDIAVAQYEKAIQTAFREVSDALVGRSTLAEQLQAQQALLAAETERSRLTKLRLDNGAASQLDWLDAQRSLFATQQALVQTRLAYLQNQIALYKALGGSAAPSAR